MVWTAPSAHIYATNETVTAATLNTYVEANLDFLYGDAAWTAATLTNSWANVGGGFSVAAYRKQGTTVLVRGRIKSGTMTTAAFTLPSGYRPVNGSLTFATVSGSLFGAVTVNTDGTVVPAVGSNTDMNINLQFDVLN